MRFHPAGRKLCGPHPDGTVCPGSQKQHPLAAWSIHLKEAAPYPFVASNRREDLEFYCLKVGFRPISLRNATMGLPMRPSCGAAWDIRGTGDNPGSVLPEDIVCIPLTYPVIERTISLTYDSRRRMSNAGQLFLQFCMEYFQAGS